jgi:Tol biopolymer transport system component
VDDSATTETSTEATAAPKGTIPYMAPEQIRSRPIDGRADIFALGVVLYEMATGQRPFRGATQTALIEAICHEAPAAPRALRPALNPKIEETILKCLDKEPARRYQTAIEVKVDLERALTPGTGSTGSTKGDKVKTRRHAFLVGAAFLAALLLAGIGARYVPAIARFFGVRSVAFVAANAQQVTFIGDAASPAISGDGKFIAFVALGAGSDESDRSLCVQEIGSGEPLTILRGRSLQALSWSPDGSQVACCGATADGSPGIYLVPRLGGTPRRFPGAAQGTAWSREGTRLLAWRISRRELRRIDIATGAVDTIGLKGDFTWLQGASWSPDDRRFVFTTIDARPRYALWTLSADGRDQRMVSEDSLPLLAPIWDSNGQGVYFLRGNEADRDLRHVSISERTGKAKGAPRVVLSARSFGRDISISRDGSRLLYLEDDLKANLWSIDLRRGAGNAPLRATAITSGTFQDTGPSVSPDGAWVAFSRQEGPKSNVFIRSLREPNSDKQVTFLPAVGPEPVWSPSGDQIAFLSIDGSRYSIRTIDLRSGSIRGLKSSPASPDQMTLTWAPGHDIVHALPNNRDYVRLDPTNGLERPLFGPARGGFRFSPRYSPDGSTVAYYSNAVEENGVWAFDLRTGQSRALAKGLDANVLGWSRDGSKVYGWGVVPGGTQIWEIPSEGGAPRLLGRIADRGGLRGLSLGPDATSAVATIEESRADAWLMENFDPQAP